MSILNDPNNWRDNDGQSPPAQWEALEQDGRYWFHNPAAPNPVSQQIRYIGSGPIPETLKIAWEIVEPPASAGGVWITVTNYDSDSDEGETQEFDLGEEVGSGELSVELQGLPDLSITVETEGNLDFYTGVVAIKGVEDEQPDYNCECEDEYPAQTLQQLRQRLMRRLGFAAQVANPPPGMTELLNDFLYDAQVQLYSRFDSLRTERIYRWTMTPGQRYYGIRANDDACADKKLNPYKVSWVGIQDLNNVWYPLVEGIPPELYTRADLTPGWPTRYEIRQCIEVFPAPQAAYTLRVKGHFGLMPFTEDSDKTTIDSDLVFLLALANAKAHYRHPDADNYAQQAASMMASLVAGTHHTARYVPRARERIQAIPPRMVRFDDEE